MCNEIALCRTDDRRQSRTEYDGEAGLDRKECFQCGTLMIGGDCATCDNAGKKEAIVMVVALAVIALVLTAYAAIQLL